MPKMTIAINVFMAGKVGLEPTTHGLTVRCSAD